jgi:hypothetical protein
MCWRNFSPSEIGDVFACGSGIRGAMVKQKPHLDSAHHIGLKPTLHTVLTVGGDAVQGGENALGGIFASRVLNLFGCNSKYFTC